MGKAEKIAKLQALLERVEDRSTAARPRLAAVAAPAAAEGDDEMNATMVAPRSGVKPFERPIEPPAAASPRPAPVAAKAEEPVRPVPLPHRPAVVETPRPAPVAAMAEPLRTPAPAAKAPPEPAHTPVVKPVEVEAPKPAPAAAKAEPAPPAITFDDGPTPATVEVPAAAFVPPKPEPTPAPVVIAKAEAVRAPEPAPKPAEAIERQPSFRPAPKAESARPAPTPQAIQPVPEPRGLSVGIIAAILIVLGVVIVFFVTTR